MALAQMDGGLFDLKQNQAVVGKLFVIKLGGATPPNTFVEHWVTLPGFDRGASVSVELTAPAATFQDFKSYLAQSPTAVVQVSPRFQRS